MASQDTGTRGEGALGPPSVLRGAVLLPSS